MLTTHNFKGKKAFFLASYLLLLSFGLLSFWSSLTQDLPKLHIFFAPVYYSLLIILVLAFLSVQSIPKTIHLLLYLLSLMLISMNLFPVLKLNWNEQTISAYVYLLVIGSIIGLLIMGKGKEMIDLLAVSVSYSTLFLLIIVITRAIPIIYQPMLLILSLGQVIAFSLAYLYTLFDHQQFQQQLKFNYSRLPKRVLLIYSLLFIVVYFIYDKEVIPSFVLIVLLFIFSIFLLAALMNSLSKSILIHSILSFILASLSLQTILGFTFGDVEIVVGVMLVFGIGAHILILKVFIADDHVAPYLPFHIIFLGGLTPLVIGFQGELGITITFIHAYSVIHILSYVVLLKSNKKNVVRKERNTSIQSSEIPILESIDEGESRENKGRRISAAERERQLALQYKSWLEKKGEKLDVDFLQKR